MLNLAPIFDHSVNAFIDFGDALEVSPLPPAVYLMQRDVINHYRHALTHYFPISLSEPFLQNSSLGTPYEKWRKFRNDDFGMLAFTIHNLIRYTSRFVYETVGLGLKKQGRFGEMKEVMGDRSYVGTLCDIRQGKQIGIQVRPDSTLELTPFGFSLDSRQVSIGDRKVLEELGAAGHAEIESLIQQNTMFGELCAAQQKRGPIALPYERLHESWCV
jgi:hypothetical protein